VNDPVKRLLEGPPLESTRYTPESRYFQIPIATASLDDGRLVRYLRRRFLPDPTALVTPVEHRVTDTDRADNLAAQYLGDPLQAWRLADANATMRVEALVEEVGRRIRVTLPDPLQGQGASHA
jgi:hypothetical protein